MRHEAVLPAVACLRRVATLAAYIFIFGFKWKAMKNIAVGVIITASCSYRHQ